MFMELSRFKKFVSWNLISLLGYFCLVIMIAFIVMYSLTSSNINMRADLNKYFYDYLINNVIFPYLSFYKIQIFLIMTLLITSIFENKYYIKNGGYGFRIFENNDRTYSKAFVTGLILNLSPIYLFTMFIVAQFMKYL